MSSSTRRRRARRHSTARSTAPSRRPWRAGWVRRRSTCGCLRAKIRDDVIATTAGAQRPFVSASLPGRVTALAPAPKGKVRAAASVRSRKPYYFDYVRTLADKTCIPTRDVRCKTESLTEAGGRVVTVQDDGKLHLWDAARKPPSALRSCRPVRGLATSRMSRQPRRLRLPNTTVSPWCRWVAAVLRTHRVEHDGGPQFLFATTGAQALAVYAYPSRCAFGFVDLGGFALLGKASWAARCTRADVAWSVRDPASDRFLVRATTMPRKEAHKGRAVADVVPFARGRLPHGRQRQ